MLIRSLLIAALAGALVLPEVALAAGGGGGHGKKSSPIEGRAPSPPSVYMPMLVAPILVQGQLHHYVYLSVTLILPDETNKMMLMDKIPYIQDALLREVHGAPIATLGDPSTIDTEALHQRLYAVCEKLVGSGIVKKVELRDTSKDVQ